MIAVCVVYVLCCGCAGYVICAELFAMLLIAFVLRCGGYIMIGVARSCFVYAL